MQSELKHQWEIGNRLFEIIEGSITDYVADVIVVPANPDMSYSGMGVQGVVLSVTGKKPFDEAYGIAERLRKEKGIKKIDLSDPASHPVSPRTGILTQAGNLSAKRLLHLVGKDYNENGRSYCTPEIIEVSVRNALQMAASEGHRSIGLPALGTGLYSVPLEDSVRATFNATKEHFTGDSPIQRVGLILYGSDAYRIVERTIAETLR